MICHDAAETVLHVNAVERDLCAAAAGWLNKNSRRIARRVGVADRAIRHIQFARGAGLEIECQDPATEDAVLHPQRGSGEKGGQMLAIPWRGREGGRAPGRGKRA